MTVHKDRLLRTTQNDDIQTQSLKTVRVIGLKCSVLVGMNSVKYSQFVKAWLFYLISRGNLCNAFSLHEEKTAVHIDQKLGNSVECESREQSYHPDFHSTKVNR